MNTNIKINIKEEKQRLLLCEKKNSGRASPLYRLYAEGTSRKLGFSVTVTLSGESAAVDLGSDFERAVAFFQRVMSGGVTPCALEDIFSDFQYLEICQ